MYNKINSELWLNNISLSVFNQIQIQISCKILKRQFQYKSPSEGSQLDQATSGSELQSLPVWELVGDRLLISFHQTSLSCCTGDEIPVRLFPQLGPAVQRTRTVSNYWVSPPDNCHTFIIHWLLCSPLPQLPSDSTPHCPVESILQTESSAVGSLPQLEKLYNATSLLAGLESCR